MRIPAKLVGIVYTLKEISIVFATIGAALVVLASALYLLERYHVSSLRRAIAKARKAQRRRNP